MKGAAFYVILTAALLRRIWRCGKAQTVRRGKAAFGNAKLVTLSVRGPRTSWALSSTVGGPQAGAVAGYQYSPALKTSGFPGIKQASPPSCKTRKRKFPATKWLSRA